jgi:hypothetical protein
MCLEGSLDELSIPDVLQIVALVRKTGWLSIDTPTGGGAIVFCRGRVFSFQVSAVLPTRSVAGTSPPNRCARGST